MKTELEIIQQMAKQINVASNDMQGSPYWNKMVSIVKVYFKKQSIKEISVNAFVDLTGLKKDIAFKVLIEINKAIFQKNCY